MTYEEAVQAIDSLEMCIRDSSEAALEELDRMKELVLQILADSMQLFLKGSGDTQLAFNVNATEEVIDNETDRLKEKHIERLNQGLCTALARCV